MSCLRRDKHAINTIKKGIKRGRKRRISLCEMGMEIASLKFPNWSGIFIRADVVLKFHLSLMADGRKSSPQWGTGEPSRGLLLNPVSCGWWLVHIRK